MHGVQLSPVIGGPGASVPKSLTAVSKAECELLAFVNSVTRLFGTDHAKFLTDIWMDALASMDRMPGPASADWQLVTQVASLRLAIRLVDITNQYVVL